MATDWIAVRAEWLAWGGDEPTAAAAAKSFLDYAHERGWFGEAQLRNAAGWVDFCGPGWLTRELARVAEGVDRG